MPEKGELHRENPEDIQSTDHCMHGKSLPKAGEKLSKKMKGKSAWSSHRAGSYGKKLIIHGALNRPLGRSCLSNGE